MSTATPASGIVSRKLAPKSAWRTKTIAYAPPQPETAIDLNLAKNEGSLPSADLLALGRRLVTVCRDADALLVVNHDVPVARECAALVGESVGDVRARTSRSAAKTRPEAKKRNETATDRGRARSVDAG